MELPRFGIATIVFLTMLIVIFGVALAARTLQGTEREGSDGGTAAAISNGSPMPGYRHHLAALHAATRPPA